MTIYLMDMAMLKKTSRSSCWIADDWLTVVSPYPEILSLGIVAHIIYILYIIIIIHIVITLLRRVHSIGITPLRVIFSQAVYLITRR